MPNRHGPLSVDDLQRHVEAEQIDTVIAAFPDLYGRLVGKRFDATYFVDSVIGAGTHACDYLLTVDMEMEPVPGYEFANWEKGYGDVHLAPDLRTLRRATWLERTAIVFCDVHSTQSHELVYQAPRSLLHKQVAAAAQLNYSAMAATELEYYIFNQTYRKAHQRGFRNLPQAATYIEDYHILQGTREEELNAAARRHLNHSGVPVECTKGEWGRGQHELNLRYSNILEMADRHILYKQCLKELADAQELSVTFMAKYDSQQAGSSCHIHVSLWNDDQQNAFAGDDDFHGIQCSDTFRWFLGGWMQFAPEMMVCYAPTVNSYKRFQSGSWAPTGLAWSIDNRTAGFRVVGHGPSLRIECRIPGADCNPYLALAAALASGLAGVEQRIEPPEPICGDVYKTAGVQRVPKTLRDAIELFESSKLAKQAFGDDVVAHYTHFFRAEQHAFDQAVTDWERTRYFERI
ncbi:MAG: glutamine synthetase [Planctomycetales bacterium]|nr:glutamine synthetase [Planctomycetales bacterium]